MNKKRIVYLDYIRAVSCIIIVIYHIRCIYNKYYAINIPSFNIGEIGVCLFFILSGSCLMIKKKK